jgi:hypothetical protein
MYDASICVWGLCFPFQNGTSKDMSDIGEDDTNTMSENSYMMKLKTSSSFAIQVSTDGRHPPPFHHSHKYPSVGLILSILRNPIARCSNDVIQKPMSTLMHIGQRPPSLTS